MGLRTGTQPIAERVLKRCSDGALRRVAIYAPRIRPRPAQGDWECRFEIVGGQSEIREHAVGVDSLQALVEALRAVQYHVARDPEPHTWLSNARGDTCLPVILPYDDPEFTEFLQQIVGVEMSRRYLYSRPRPPPLADQKKPRTRSPGPKARTRSGRPRRKR
jgi:hypothetical protein